MFILNPDLNVNSLKAKFAETGSVRIENFLIGDAADQLYASLRERDDWLEVLNSGEKLIELTREARSEITAEQESELSQAVYAMARDGFQFRYETIRVPDGEEERAAIDDLIVDFASWLSSGKARDFFRNIVGDDDILFADAQATAYSPGHFLTGHDDNVDGKHRRAAYVFGLTPVWRTEWGGLLLFHNDSTPDVSGWVPAHNCISLFAVPQQHSVSEVTKSAAYRRYSITGWLRTKL